VLRLKRGRCAFVSLRRCSFCETRPAVMRFSRTSRNRIIERVRSNNAPPQGFERVTRVLSGSEKPAAEWTVPATIRARVCPFSAKSAGKTVSPFPGRFKIVKRPARPLVPWRVPSACPLSTRHPFNLSFSTSPAPLGVKYCIQLGPCPCELTWAGRAPSFSARSFTRSKMLELAEGCRGFFEQSCRTPVRDDFSVRTGESSLPAKGIVGAVAWE